MVQSIAEILQERGKVHGDFTVNAVITQNLKGVAQSDCGNYTSLSPPHREAIDMILHKIGRILAGDPNHRDHWDDIAGYAKLASDRCKSQG